MWNRNRKSCFSYRYNLLIAKTGGGRELAVLKKMRRIQVERRNADQQSRYHDLN